MKRRQVALPAGGSAGGQGGTRHSDLRTWLRGRQSARPATVFRSTILYLYLMRKEKKEITQTDSWLKRETKYEIQETERNLDCHITQI